jgi:sensor histidine kinase YesM
MYALQAQINPHFLFNTLSTISALAEQDAALTQRTIGRLANLFRYTLSCSQCEFVSLTDELEFVRDYLGIEQLRLGSRLRVEWLDDTVGAGVRLPGLTLQPLVENAIRHGVARRVTGGVVRVQIRRASNHCRIDVSNEVADGDDLPDLSHHGAFRPGHALSNVRERLHLHFRGEAWLELEANTPGWVHARVFIPFSEKALM